MSTGRMGLNRSALHDAGFPRTHLDSEADRCYARPVVTADALERDSREAGFSTGKLLDSDADRVHNSNQGDGTMPGWKTILLLADSAGRAPQTILDFLRGHPCRATTLRSVNRALDEHGLAHLRRVA